jgi:hypothetical protein
MNRPGKYEGNADQDLAEVLRGITLDGCCEEGGDVDEFGLWFAKVDYAGRWFTVTEDSQGFFDYQEYESSTARDAAFDEQEAEWISATAECEA